METQLRAPLSFLVLYELRNPKTGAQLSKAIGKRRSGELSPGTIYPLLRKLHKKKLIFYRSKGRDKIYSLTPLGEETLNKLKKDFKRLFKGLKHLL